MDPKILLILLLLNVTVTLCDHSIGYLLYMPGNLRSGSTNQAYIELNTTEEVSIRLDFIHQQEDRHYSSRAIITGGAGFVEFEVPEVDYWYGRVNLTGMVESTKEVFYDSKDDVYIWADAQKVTFIETDKPIYKPGQKVHFRLVTIDSQFKPDTTIVSKIQVQTPQGIKVNQWRNVERPQGLVDMSFQLIEEPPLGKYAVRAYINGEWISQTFKVEEYVLPKLEVTINAASYLMIDAEEYSFQVCAKYTYGQPVRGSVSGQVGKVERSYSYNYYPRPQVVNLGGESEEEEEEEMEDAVTFSGELDKEGCLDVTVDVTEMDLASYASPYYRNNMGVAATVIEGSTGNEYKERQTPTHLEAVRMNVALESPTIFKPSLPYQGQKSESVRNEEKVEQRLVSLGAWTSNRYSNSDLNKQDQTLKDLDRAARTGMKFASSQLLMAEVISRSFYDPEGSGINDGDLGAIIAIKLTYPDQKPAVGEAIEIKATVERTVVHTEVYTAEEGGIVHFEIPFATKNQSIQLQAYTPGTGDDDYYYSYQRNASGYEIYPVRSYYTLNPAYSPTGRYLQIEPIYDAVSAGDPVQVNVLYTSDESDVSSDFKFRFISRNQLMDAGAAQVGQSRKRRQAEADPIELPFGEIGPPDLFNQCQEGFQFAEGVKKCVRIETECQRQAREADEKPLIGGFKPNCTEEGKFTPKQCHGSTGHCWCVEEETGVEIDGTRTGPTEERSECTITIETECQRQAREADEKPLIGGFKPDCTEEGKFTPKQCHGSTGHCWCVEEETGVEIDGTRTGPTEERSECTITTVNQSEASTPCPNTVFCIVSPCIVARCKAFPEATCVADYCGGCFDRWYMDGQLVDCNAETECQRQAREADEKALIGGFKPNCTEEGKFTPKQCHGSTGHCWCVDVETGVEKTGTRTGPTEERFECIITIAILTICQRRVEQAERRGLALGAFKPECDEEGKFEAQQCHGSTGECWCVDVDLGIETLGTRTGPMETRADCSETVCQRQAREADEKALIGGFKPNCTEEGTFTPMQCHGSTGHCWCVEGMTGEELDGTRTGPTEERMECTVFIETLCQRQAREADEKALIGGFRPSCTEEGQFTPEQCHGSTGHCWCVEEGTGEEIDGTRTGPTEERTTCTGTIVILTACQQQVRDLEGRGLPPGAFKPECDDEGKFEAQQCHGSTGQCWCVEVELGGEIPETRTGPTETRVDCSETECQRKARIVDEGRLVGVQRPSCEEDGSYSMHQCHGSTGHCWCVDTESGKEIEGTRTGPGEDKHSCIVLVTIPPIVVEHVTPPPVVHVDPQDLHRAAFTVQITPNLSPEAILLVYYTSPEGEIVSDSIRIKVNEAFENEVTLDFEDAEVKPGGETKMSISAESGSLCGVGIIDKSVYVLAGENKMTPKKLFSAFDLSTRTYYNPRNCPHIYSYYRGKRSIAYPGYYGSSVNYKDSLDVFSNSGLLTLTNFDLEVAPCVYHPVVEAYSRVDSDEGREVLAAAPGGQGGRGREESKEVIRSYFPSTWLWTLQTIGDSPAKLDLDVPHSITDWIANGFCTNMETGVGIAPPVTLRAFQPFFLSMSLPYAIIREEKTPIQVTVFNYLDQCLMVRVNLTDSEEFIISGEDVFTVAVPASESTTVTFRLAASSIGEIPIQVSAVSIDVEDALCGNEAVAGPAGATDTVIRMLKVKPEGEEETITESQYVCLEEDMGYLWRFGFLVPEQHVRDTAKGEITVTGDLVGKTLSNVEDLIRMPYGCGEQNLLSMVPNIVALQYLESIGEATPEVAAEAKKFILAGYQRELNYRRNDASYSAFGNSNPAGSTFLTAFVIRTYAQAQRFVDIDQEDLFVTINWLRSIQEKDGSFRTVGYLAHKAMKGGVNNNVTLAAYVVSTFLEAGYSLGDKTVFLAFDYLNSQLDSIEDNYAAAILAYAYALAQMDQFEQVYEKLQESVIEAAGTRHWESNRGDLPSYTTYYQASDKAQNVEMTAYVLRAILLVKGFPNVETVGSSIARWLVAQRNPRGGFSSTQDTVIGLTALAEFSKLGSQGTTDLSISFEVVGEDIYDFDVTIENRFLIQRGSYEDFNAEVAVSAEGVGCFLYAVSVDYYIKRQKQTMDPFSIEAKPKGIPLKRRRRDASSESEESSEEEEETCDQFTIRISARYNGEDGASNMAIINFRPVSGFIFDPESLASLKEEYDFLRRYEINGDTITFYFDEITTEGMEFEVGVVKEFEVEDAKPALITILDYYENDLKVSEEFEFLCGGGIAEFVETSSPSTTYTTPVSPLYGFGSSTPTADPVAEDVNECEVPDVCGGPEWMCVNYQGTYECVCAEGYELDEGEVNCIEIPSCPICANALPEGMEDLICASGKVETMKVRVDGSVRPLFDLLAKRKYNDDEERFYYDIDIDDACTCELLAKDSRIIVAYNTDRAGEFTSRRKRPLYLDDTVLVVENTSEVKKDIHKALDAC